MHQIPDVCLQPGILGEFDARKCIVLTGKYRSCLCLVHVYVCVCVCVCMGELCVRAHSCVSRLLQ